MSKILSIDKMEKCCDVVGDKIVTGGGAVYKFIPSLIKLFPASGNMHKMNFRQRLRFLLMLPYGYRVYVFVNYEGDIMGCAVFGNGGNPRYSFSTKNDLIIGPYYVMPEFRRKGVAFEFIRYIIEKIETNYDSIFAHVWFDNKASIRCLKKLGFECAGTLTVKFHKMIFDEKGKMVLLKK